MIQPDSPITATLDTNAKRIQGHAVPSLGFGTFGLGGDECQRGVETALETGYRHLDTARMYGNEVEVGRALHDSKLDRDQVFLTSKVWRDDLDSESVVREVQKSLELLRTDYLDLVLIHWPNPAFPLEATMQALLSEKMAGYVRHIGVSNFPSAEFKRALAYAPVFCNQVEYHPLLSQKKVIGAARAHDALVTAYSPLAQGEILDQPTLQEIGEKHGKTPGQVALRWLIEQDHVAAIPRSSKPEHIKANFDVFDFALDENDHHAIERLPKNKRVVNPEFAPAWDDE